MPVAMFLIRTPFTEFTFRNNTLRGRWGTLIVVDAAVTEAPTLQANPIPGGAAAANTISVGEDRMLVLPANTGAITTTHRYTTIERTQGYVMLRPNCPHDPPYRNPKVGAYTVNVENGNPVVRNLYRAGRPPAYTGPVYHDGACLRIHGAMSQPERGILFHEAPNVGWLIGCISPRNFGSDVVDLPTELNPRRNPVRNESHAAMQELFTTIGRQTANLWVLDW